MGMGHTGGFAVQILLHTNNAALRVSFGSGALPPTNVLKQDTNNLHPVTQPEEQSPSSLLKLSGVSGIDPKARQFLVSQLPFQMGLFLPSASQALASGKSLFPSGLCCRLPTHVVNEERSSCAPVMSPRGYEAAGCSAPGSQPQLSLLRVGAAARSSLALLTAAGFKASIVCRP